MNVNWGGFPLISRLPFGVRHTEVAIIYPNAFENNSRKYFHGDFTPIPLFRLVGCDHCHVADKLQPASQATAIYTLPMFSMRTTKKHGECSRCLPNVESPKKCKGNTSPLNMAMSNKVFCDGFLATLYRPHVT